MTVDELQTRLLTGIGAAVVHGQVVEKLMGLVLSTALPGTDLVTIETMTSEEQKNLRATLGRLIDRLRTRVELDESLDDVLTRYLEDRNALIHDHDRIEGFGVARRAELDTAIDFVGRHIKDAHTLVRIFANLLHEWTHQLPNAPATPDEILRIIGEERGQAANRFFAKPSRPDTLTSTQRSSGKAT